MNDFNQPGWERALAAAFDQREKQAGYTDIRTVKLGNTDDPPVYVVSRKEREHPHLPLMWVHRETDNGIELIQAVNDGTANIPFSNNLYPIQIKIGIPPGENQHFLMRPTVSGLSGFAMPPGQLALMQAQLQRPDRDVFNSIFHSSGLKVGLRAGLLRFGNRHVHNQNQVNEFWDVADYLPASGERWVLLGQDSTGQAIYTAGDEYDPDTQESLAFIPVELQSDAFYFGRVLLVAGDTDLAGKLTIFPDTHAVPADLSIPIFVTLAGAQELSNKIINNTNTITIKDANFTVQDDGDATKQLRLQLSGIPTATTVTLTPPPASDTIVSLTAAQTLTNKTLTSPTIAGGTIDNTVIGGTTPAIGSFTTIDTTLVDAGTTNQIDGIILRHGTTGTPAANFGTNFRLVAHTSTNSYQSLFVFSGVWADATHASRRSRVFLRTFDASNARECIRLEASGTAPMLGFYGSAAVVRQVLSSTAGYTVTNLTTDRSYDANATSIDELADVLGTLAADFVDFRTKILNTGLVA